MMKKILLGLTQNRSSGVMTPWRTGLYCLRRHVLLEQFCVSPMLQKTVTKFMRKLSTVSLVFSLAFVSICVHAAEHSPVGTWKTIDDETKQVKSLVKITETNGELQGKVEKIFSPPAKLPDPPCDKCEGDKKDKPIVGMTILSGLKKNGDEYSGGTILDPGNGKTYKCKIKVAEDGNSLEVRGFIGFSLLGRTQVWVRDQ